MEDLIRFELGDWRTNASIYGLIRILRHNKREYLLDETGVEIKKEVLENFEEDYFNYFSDTYEEDLPWYRIISYGDRLDYQLENPEKITREDLEYLNKQLDLVKDYFTRNNYKKVYPLIKGGEGLEKKVKGLKKIKLRKKDKLEDRLEEIIGEMTELREVMNLAKGKDGKKHIRAKGVIYSFINRGIDGVGFLNRNTKYIDVFEDYRNYFIRPLEEKLANEKEVKNPYECFSCGSPINTIGESYTINLVKNTGFDVDKKSSYVWNHMSDILICPKCNFLYSMISAGFTYSPYEGIFINYSRNIEGLVDANDSAKGQIEKITRKDNRSISYRTIVAVISRQNIRDLDYEINDIQVVRYKDEKYHFNILAREVLDLIKKSSGDLEVIESLAYKEGNTYFSIYDQVLDRIFNGQNMFSLVHLLLVRLISKNSQGGNFYNSYHIGRILNINYRIVRGGMDMGKIDMEKQIYFTRKAGNDHRRDYLTRGMEKRINGISYRLLNALKTRNVEFFMDNILKSYMYLGKPVPQNMTLALESEENLALIGYAFVTGLNGSEEYGKNKNIKEKVEEREMV